MRPLTILLVALSLCRPVSGFTQEIVAALPENPHGLMTDDVPCENCHDTAHDSIQLHEFTMEITEQCRGCHYDDQIGRSHPTDIDLRFTKRDIIYPNRLPLQDYKMTCGTCHDPHDEWLAPFKCYGRQRPEVILLENEREYPYYKTFFLRIYDNREGFALLCRECHKEF